jgi:hypothetical protein
MENWRGFVHESKYLPTDSNPDLAAKIITRAVIQDIAPGSDREIELIYNTARDPSAHEFQFYTGQLYRGMVMSKSEFMRNYIGRSGAPGELPKKHIFNLIRRIKGEIAVRTNSLHFPESKGDRMESWSKSYSVAEGYALNLNIGAMAQRSGVESELMAFVMVADAGDEYNKEKFIDLKPLQKIAPDLKQEASIQEVPAFLKNTGTKAIRIEKIIIPYREFDRVFKSRTEPGSGYGPGLSAEKHEEIAQAIAKGKLKPVQFEE